MITSNLQYIPMDFMYREILKLFGLILAYFLGFYMQVIDILSDQTYFFAFSL